MVTKVSLNSKLHLVVPVYDAECANVVAYAHSAPISTEIFEAHFMLLAKTFADIHAKGLSIISGPAVASLLLAQVAREQRDEEGGVALMNEIRRLTNVLMRTPAGWNPVAFQDVVDHGLLSPEDVREVTNAIVFFTLTWSIQRRTERKVMMDGAAQIWGARTSSSDFTAFAASLTTSTADASMMTLASSATY